VSEHAQEDVVAACRAVLTPLARLAVARGLSYAQISDLLKTALVQAARAVHADAGHRIVSRISAATGLTRREVTRRVAGADESTPLQRRSPATEVFTRWLSDPQLRGKKRGRAKLPRQGDGPSFETLAQSVTRDVHPRTLLDEICRLGLARYDEASDTVELVRDTFVPQDDQRRMLGFMAANVGDHLTAAVSNVLASGPRHLEQAVFADELSAQSLDEARPLIAAQWQSVVQHLAPALRQMIDEDRAAGRAQDQRLRVGLYAYTARMAEGRDEGDSDVRS
jgi:hypothetical protein